MRIFNEKREHGEQHERKSTLHIVSSAAAEHKEIDTFMRKLLSDLRYTVLYRIGTRKIATNKLETIAITIV